MSPQESRYADIDLPGGDTSAKALAVLREAAPLASEGSLLGTIAHGALQAREQYPASEYGYISDAWCLSNGTRDIWERINFEDRRLILEDIDVLLDPNTTRRYRPEVQAKIDRILQELRGRVGGMLHYLAERGYEDIPENIRIVGVSGMPSEEVGAVIEQPILGLGHFEGLYVVQAPEEGLEAESDEGFIPIGYYFFSNEDKPEISHAGAFGFPEEFPIPKHYPQERHISILVPREALAAVGLV